ncbi:MAG: thiol reductant ABC exporter subunit CydC [Acetobacteraceae bacterium]|nr:thiol reductant ABC exporter subunit CydC [Acetobacteraceae bacterium]
MILDIRRILGLWRGRLVWLAAGVLVSLAALAAGVGLMVFAGAALASLSLFAPLMLRGLGVARVVLRYAERMVTHAAMFRALADLRVWLFRRLTINAAGGLGFRQAGDVLSRLVNDVEALDGLYLRVLVPLAGAVFVLPLTVIVIAPRMPLLALAVAILFLLAAFLLPCAALRSAQDAGTRLTGAMGQLRIAVLDTMTGWREVRAFGAEGRMLANVQAREAALLGAQDALARRTAFAGAGAFLCAQAAVFAVLCAAGSNSTRMIVAAFLVLAAFETVGGLPRAGAYLGHAAAAARRVLEAADAPVAVPDPVSPVALPRGTRLGFDGIHFRWRPELPPVFDGLTMDIAPGARVGILGPSGSGKSTLAALALKLAAPQAGQILLGRIDIATLTAADVRSRIGWLNQSTHLFDDTIRANLLLARPDADDASLWAAVDSARIGEVVRGLPEGLDTWVGEGGARFSGGQGRRLALARALLSPMPILILDEPCAGLDAKTEREFLATLNEVGEGRTVILIAHRLVGVEALDRIYRLSGGKAVAAAG